MNSFSVARFRRLLANDFLNAVKPLAMITLAALCAVALLYFLTLHTAGDARSPLRNVLFGIFLFGTGLIHTSVIFSDLHHSTERYRYLMLPCSNAERFLSRYVLTGPLFLLYAIVAFYIMDRVGDAVSSATIPPFSPFDFGPRWNIIGYVLSHVLYFTGAIFFRSFSLIKTAVSLALLEVSVLAVGYLSLRVFYPEAFSGLKLNQNIDIALPLIPLFAETWMNIAAIGGFALWILFVAYRCLCEHEVQDEL
jgi:heme/copper-type cytochrome/quinol oxidase subunit 4